MERTDSLLRAIRTFNESSYLFDFYISPSAFRSGLSGTLYRPLPSSGLCIGDQFRLGISIYDNNCVQPRCEQINSKTLTLYSMHMYMTLCIYFIHTLLLKYTSFILLFKLRLPLYLLIGVLHQS